MGVSRGLTLFLGPATLPRPTVEMSRVMEIEEGGLNDAGDLHENIHSGPGVYGVWFVSPTG